MATEDNGVRAQVEDDETTDDTHGGCSICVFDEDRAGMPVPEAFALVGYGRAFDSELRPDDDLIVDAYGMILPDGRVVTHTDDPHRSGENRFRIWSQVEDAAGYWGSCVLWTSSPSEAHQPAACDVET